MAAQWRNLPEFEAGDESTRILRSKQPFTKETNVYKDIRMRK